MANLSKLEILLNLGFDHDPFREKRFETSDAVRIRRLVGMAIKSNAMVSIVGLRGSGKSVSVMQALNALKVRPVMVRSADKPKLHISEIEQAMIFDLSEEKPKRGKEIRTRQLRRVLGEASRRQRVVVVIEEGHRLHGMTLRALKTLRELDWMGETELFSVILLGQSDPMNKAGVSEVRLRSDAIHMHGLTADEIAGYIQGTVGRIFSDEAIDAICELGQCKSEAKNFLNLQDMLIRLMGHVLADGRKVVEVEDVNLLLGKQDRTPLRNTRKPKKTTKTPKSDPIKSGNNALQSVLSRRKGGDEGKGMRQAV